jgi:UDPglucose 6-dehydrogenase
MKVSIVGTGYVGLVSGTCFAELGHIVTCIDIDPDKVALLRTGKSPIYEPGLNEMLERNIQAERLSFSTEYDSVADAQAIFLAVGTPSGDDGQADLKYLKSASESIAEKIQPGGIIVIKSTVPVGTNQFVTDWVKAKTEVSFDVVNNPEFLKEGSAVDDFMRPDRVVIGHGNENAANVMSELYEPLVRQGNPIFMMSNLSAEMTKYAANCFLATKISFINEIARLCDLTGADIDEVRKGITSDSRIGGKFLYPGVGYGGSCFPKDVQALIYTARQHDSRLEIIESAHKVNDTQKTFLFDKILKHFKGDLKDKFFAFWGVAFKPNTDDIREAPAIYMAEKLLEAGAKVQFFDPVAADNYEEYMNRPAGEITRINDKYDCLEGCSALVLLTEWASFRNVDFDIIKKRLKDPVIFDGRNIFKTETVLEKGFSYYAIGKRIPATK